MFWMSEHKKSSLPKRMLLRYMINEDEMQRIDAYSKKMGYSCPGAFALDCMRYVMNEGEESSIKNDV